LSNLVSKTGIIPSNQFGIIQLISNISVTQATRNQKTLLTIVLSATEGPIYLEELQISFLDGNNNPSPQAANVVLSNVKVNNVEECVFPNCEATLFQPGGYYGEVVSLVNSNSKVKDPFGNNAIAASTNGVFMDVSATGVPFSGNTTAWVTATVAAPLSAKIDLTLGT